MQKFTHLNSHGINQRPFNRVAFYHKVHYPPETSVHTIVKHRKCIVAPTLHDTFYFTIPVRNHHDTQSDNCILAFLCEKQARYYCDMLNNETKYKINHEEPQCTSVLERYSIGDLSYNAYNICTKICIVCNSFCEGQAEPFFSIGLVEKPQW